MSQSVVRSPVSQSVSQSVVRYLALRRWHATHLRDAGSLPSFLTHSLTHPPTNYPSQDMLLEQYTKELHDNFGISFNELFTITNMPVLTQHSPNPSPYPSTKPVQPALTQCSQHLRAWPAPT